MLKFLLPVAVCAGLAPVVTLNNGVKMPVAAAGSWQYTTDQAESSVTTALKVGWRHIDTAHDYCGDGSTGTCPGKSVQVGVGAALKKSGMAREDYFVTTKVPGCGLQGTSMDNCGPDSVAAHEDNLKQLGLEYTDLLLVHFPPVGGCGSSNCPAIQQQWASLTTLLASNKTRALGVSNFCQSCFDCILTDASVVVPALNQVQLHVGMGTDPEGLVSFCQKKGIVMEAYSPLGDGSAELVTGELVTAIGQAHGKSGPTVALKWLWQNGITLTTKSTNATYLAEDLDLFDWMLTDDEMAKLNSATKPAGTPSFMCKA